jgi:hypothetical protein
MEHRNDGNDSQNGPSHHRYCRCGSRHGGEARNRTDDASKSSVCTNRAEDRLLHDVPSQTIFFTDRPNRVVGNLPTNAFVAKWTTDKGPNGFASNPPNAAVTVFQPDGIRTAVVELRNPRLDGSKLSYNVKVLQGIASTQPASGVLVIDDFPEAWARNAFQVPG